MIKTVAGCDYNGYCSNTKVPVSELTGWYEISVDEADGKITVTVREVGELSPAHTSLLACSAVHAEEIMEKEISKMLYRPRPVPVLDVPVVATEPESDVPF